MPRSARSRKLQDLLVAGEAATAALAIFLSSTLSVVLTALSRSPDEVSFREWVTHQDVGTPLYYIAWAALCAYFPIVLYGIYVTSTTIYRSYRHAVERGAAYMPIDIEPPAIILVGTLVFAILMCAAFSDLTLPAIIIAEAQLAWLGVMYRIVGRPVVRLFVGLDLR